MKKKILPFGLAFGLVLIFFAGGFLYLTNNSTGPTGNILKATKANPDGIKEGITTGKIAKDFSLTTIEGNEIKLSDFRGKTVVFSFMATWCVPCQIEAENIKKVQSDNSLVVIQIDIDPRENKQDLIQFRKEFGNKDWIMALDKDYEIAKAYKVRSFDTTIVVDQDGKIIYRDEGWPIDVKTLRELLKGKFQQLVLGSTHEHATITVKIKNNAIDFSQPKYQVRSPFVHFEDGDGKKVHVHAKGVTLKYLFETLGWKVEKDCIVTDFGRFCNGKITVNGKKSGLGHEIKDGDVIEVMYNER